MKGLSTQALTIGNGNRLLCSNLTVHFAAGEIWGILGSNGAGKTTLLHRLAGMTNNSVGEVFLNGKALATLPHKVKAQEVGILFQETSHSFAQPIWDFCLTSRYPHHATQAQDKEIVHAALDTMHLSMDHKKMTCDLSGGEKRRVAIAALLSQQPNIYLLDEPTNHLDNRFQTIVMQHFAHLAKAQGKTIVMVLHDINLAAHFCDALILLHQDGTADVGTPAKILTEENLTCLYQHPMIRADNVWMSKWV